MRDTTRDRWAPVLLPAAAVLLAGGFLWLYAPSLTGGFYLDSKPFFFQTPLFPGGVTPGQAMARVLDQGTHPAAPRLLTNLTFALQTWRAGPRPGPLRAVNAVIHAANALLLALFVGRLLTVLAPWWGRAKRRLASGAAALLWGMNPFLADTVAYIYQRGVLLQTFFFLSAAILLWDLSADEACRGRGVRWMLLSLSLVAGALSKETMILFPVTLAACLAYLRPRPGSPPRGRTAALGVGLAAVIVPLAVFVVRLRRPHLPGSYADFPFTLGERLLSEARVVVDQAATFLLPLPGRLALPPFYQVSRGLLTPPSTLAAIILLGATAAMLPRWRRSFPAAGLAIIWYLTGHLMESTVLPLELAFAHRSYLPAALLPLPLVLLAERGAARLKRPMLLIAAMLLPLLVLLAAGTRHRAWEYGDEERFLTVSIRKTPRAVLPYVSLSYFYLDQGRPREALAVTVEGLSRASFADDRASVGPDLLVNRGLACERLGDIEQAIAWVRRGLERQPADIDYRFNLAVLLTRTGDNTEAESLFLSILDADPAYPDINLQLGLLSERRGRLPEALALVERETALYPGNLFAQAVLARLRRKAGRGSAVR